MMEVETEGAVGGDMDAFKVANNLGLFRCSLRKSRHFDMQDAWRVRALRMVGDGPFPD
jgi:hypothetical protein